MTVRFIFTAESRYRRHMMLHKVLPVLALVVAMLTANDTSAATLFRTYLSVDGNDSNPCTVSAPCRLLPAALASTQNAGEIWILDSANYNTSAVSINQSVSILAVPGALGSFVANGGDAVDIVGSATIAVTFRNLVFREIDNYGDFVGINVNNENAQVIVEGSQFSSLEFGFRAFAWETIDISRTNFYQIAGDGIQVGANSVPSSKESTVTIDHCDFRNNATYAVNTQDVVITLSHNTMSNNGAGLETNEGTIVDLDGNTITGNYYGIEQNGGTIYSSGTNNIVNNQININGSISASPLQ